MSVIDDINAGKLSIKEGGQAAEYEMTSFVINDCKAVAGGSNEHPLVKASDKDQVFLLVTIKALDGKGKGFIQDIAGGLLTKKGDIACYPATEGYPKGTLLFDLKEAINAVVPLKEGWMKTWRPADFIGKKFKMNAKYLEKANTLILETSYQKVRDQKYLENHQSQDKTEPKTTNIIGDNGEVEKVEVVDSDSLPF